MKLIPLTQGQFAKVDDEDYDYLMQWKWHAKFGHSVKSYYATRTGQKTEGHLWKKVIIMHRIIMNCPKYLEVDHVYHDTLDNRKSKLRICNHSQNTMNQQKRSDNISGYRGVNSKHGKWCAQIQTSGKKIYLGMFNCKHEAAKAYNIASRMYHGRFGYQNIIVD